MNKISRRPSSVTCNLLGLRACARACGHRRGGQARHARTRARARARAQSRQSLNWYKLRRRSMYAAQVAPVPWIGPCLHPKTGPRHRSNKAGSKAPLPTSETGASPHRPLLLFKQARQAGMNARTRMAIPAKGQPEVEFGGEATVSRHVRPRHGLRHLLRLAWHANTVCCMRYAVCSTPFTVCSQSVRVVQTRRAVTCNSVVGVQS